VLSVGLDQVPLSLQSATPVAALVFPARVALSDQFIVPVQAGLQVTGMHDRGNVTIGVWNGSQGDVTTMTTEPERGLLFSARVEATPLGKFAFDENGGKGALRVGIGLGATYRAASSYLADGMSQSRSRDLRAAVSLRVGWHGLLAEAEVLRRQITDDLSMRPDVATGAYLQASYRFRVHAARLVPLLRLGTLAIRQLAAPASGQSVEAGLAAFPLASDRLRLTALYEYLEDPDLGPSHHAIAQLRLAF
jgi:hypothetical protein